jgi:hypothetical protein
MTGEDARLPASATFHTVWEGGGPIRLRIADCGLLIFADARRSAGRVQTRSCDSQIRDPQSAIRNHLGRWMISTS